MVICTFLSLKKVISIPAARVPIVKCVDATSGLNCDLSFKNKMAVYNTKFILDICNSDPLILHFVVMIRYWATRQNLTGSVAGNGGIVISNYGLTMMVLFFLQLEHVLPSVMILQEDLMASEKLEIGGWEYGYRMLYLGNVKEYILEHSEGKWRWKNWLYKFFDFYLRFNYEELVISPYAGHPILRTQFQNIALSLKKIMVKHVLPRP